MSKIRPGTWALLGLVVAVIGIIAPIGWDRYKSQASLELQHISSLSLIESSGSLPKLELRYDGKVIKGASRLVFVLVNTGRTPILEKDLVSAPTISFEPGTMLLDVEREKAVPVDLDWNYKLDESTRSIRLEFALLNPGDSIQFGVLIGGRAPRYELKARVVGIKQVTVVDRTKEVQKAKRPISWTVYVVGATSTLFLLVLLVSAIPELIEERRVKTKLRDGSLPVPKNRTPEEYKTFVRSIYSKKIPSETRPLWEMFDDLPQDQALTADQQNQFEQTLSHYASRPHAIGYTILIAIVVVCGAVYVFMKLYGT